MKKLFCIILTLFFSSHLLTAQSALTSNEMVSITPAVASKLDLPEYAKSRLQQKLIQIVTQNGFGATGSDIVLTGNVMVTDAETTGTVPAMTLVNAEASFYLVNVGEEVILDELSVTVRGIDINRDRAIIKAVNAINPRSIEIRNFMNQCRIKVTDYYSTKIPALMAKANSLEMSGQYDEAMKVLASIPENVAEYPAIANKLTSIFITKIDKEAESIILGSKILAGKKDYIGAIEMLMGIDPFSSRFAELDGMIASLQSQISNTDKTAVSEQLETMKTKKEEALKAKDNTEKLKQAKEAAAVHTASSSEDNNISDSLNNWFLKELK